MKLITNVEQLKGKTIEAILHDDDFLLMRFIDGSACAFESESDCDGISTIEITGIVHSDQHKLFLGMTTQEEIDERNKKQAEQNNHFQLSRDYHHYHELKARFEGKTFEEIKEGSK
jgi:hypothetical protein